MDDRLRLHVGLKRRVIAWDRWREGETKQECRAARVVRGGGDFAFQHGHDAVCDGEAEARALGAESADFFRSVERTEQVVLLGGDTDTNAAIAGALLGAVHGRDAIPSTWRRAL